MINKINLDNSYQGYIWMSDKQAPEVFVDGHEDISLDPNLNPFIIEAQLCSIELGISYSIKYVDGDYIIKEYNLNEEGNYEIKTFIPARMPNVDKLRFRQYWKAENDKMNYDWLMLKPGKFVFEGFETKEIIL